MEKYETLGKRFWASILDSLILVPVQWITAFLTWAVSSSATALAVSTAAIGLLSVFYYILMHYYYGQTVGKMVTKVKVVDDSEGPISFGQAVLRNLHYLIPAMFAVSFSTANEDAETSTTIVGGLIYGLAFTFYIADVIVCLVNYKRRALHDFIAGTIVVRTDV